MSITDLRDLKTFCSVVDLRSFTAAARASGESNPTVTRRIARLEQLLGVQLLRRNPKRVEPTEEGAQYRQHLAQVLTLLEDANTTVQQARLSPGGLLRITAPPEFGALLAPVFVEFGERYPDVALDVSMTHRRADLGTDPVDVAIRFSFGLADSSLVAHRLMSLEVGFVASPAYVQRRGAPARVEDLAAHRVVMLAFARPGNRSPSTTRGWRALDALTAKMRPWVTSSELNFVRDLAVAGGGVAFLPSVCVARELADGRLVRVLRDQPAMPAASLYLVHEGGRILTPKVRAFRAHMVAAFAPKRSTT